MKASTDPRTAEKLRRATRFVTDPRSRAALRERSPGVAAQWLAVTSPQLRAQVGLEEGPATWLREARNRRVQRRWTVCLLEYPRATVRFGRLMAAWINENSRCFRAVVNREADTADVLWTFTQDPLSEAAARALAVAYGRARPDAVILNPAERYDAYHSADGFDRLERAGVNVPRSRLSDDDVGLPVVYKAVGEQASRKSLEPYDGPRAGFRAFEYIEAQGNGGHRRYRAFYLAGLVRPSKVAVSPEWNARASTASRMELGFTATAKEQQQIQLIASTFGLDYFAVDYLRRNPDGEPFFVDINVFPTIRAVLRDRGGILRGGEHHTFDERVRAGLPEPMGAPMPRLFDEALSRRVLLGQHGVHVHR